MKKKKNEGQPSTFAERISYQSPNEIKWESEMTEEERNEEPNQVVRSPKRDLDELK